MEWLGGTISKEDVGEEGTNSRQNQSNKRRRDDDNEEDALGAFALRFKQVARSLFSAYFLDRYVQAPRVLPKSSSSATNVLFQRPETNSRCPCLSFAWALATSLFRFRCGAR